MNEEQQQQQPTSQKLPTGSSKQKTIAGSFWSSKTPIKKAGWEFLVI